MQCMGFLDLVLPQRCSVCSREVPGPVPACGHCLTALEGTRLRGEGRCRRCFARLREESAPDCPFCGGRHLFFHSHTSLFGWSPKWQRAVSAWKFGNRRAAGLLFEAACREVAARGGPWEAIAWIRNGPRKRQRTFEPVGDLLGYLRAPGAHQLPELRLGKRSGGRQSGRRFAERFLAVRGTLALPAPISVPGVVLFLDDLFTTGATANEAARLLAEQGAREVHVLSLVMREDLDFS